MKKRIFAVILTAAMCFSLTGCAHIYHMSQGTYDKCTEDRPCATCGKIIEPAKGHSFKSRPIDVIPGDCKTPSIETYECSRCGATETREGKLADHTPGETVINGRNKETICSVCGTVISSEEIPLEEDPEYLIANCTEYTYEQMARNPENVKGELAVVTGEVIQALENGNEYQMRVNITLTGSEYYQYYTDTIFVTYTKNDGDSRILENDIVTIYGVLNGTVTYTSVLGAEVTLPALDGKYLIINNIE